jgi:NADH-quinone oxidoreductase subunit F
MRILNRITEGAGTPHHLELLDELSRYIRDCSLCGLGQTAPNPVLTTLRHFRNEFEDHIIAHRCAAGVCEELALSPCENSCPLHMNIPRFLQLYKENRLEEAFLSVILDNPLPASTGRVCQHPCDSRCRRQTLDQSVNMREVHRFIADSIFNSDKYEPMVQAIVALKLEPTGRKIAIVGAGPAGLTASFYLALLGHDVTVYDSKSEAGGMLRFALPEYRLPKSALRREIDLIEALGVKFTFNTRVGVDMMMNELEDHFDMIFLSVGTWKEITANPPGAELKGVYPALNFLEAVAAGQEINLGRRVAVIGGGNAAIDSARTALRKGCEVTVFYRREYKDMPAIEEETRDAKDEGARFTFLATPHRVIGDAKGNVKAIEMVKTRLAERDSSGRRKPVLTDEIQRFECDSVIFAIGETVDLDFIKASSLTFKPSGTVDVNRFTLETSRPRFFAGGDLVTGASNVSTAMSYGKQAARNIDLQLMQTDRWQKLYPQFEYEQTPPEEPSASRRHTGHSLLPSARMRSRAEVVAGLSREEALDESCRCLRCDVKTVAVS